MGSPLPHPPRFAGAPGWLPPVLVADAYLLRGRLTLREPPVAIDCQGRTRVVLFPPRRPDDGEAVDVPGGPQAEEGAAVAGGAVTAPALGEACPAAAAG